MAQFQALIAARDMPEAGYEKGDILKVRAIGKAWGNKEGPPDYEVRILDEKDFYDVKNLELPIQDTDMADFPVAIRKDPLRLAAYAHARRGKTITYRRYRVNDDNKVEDKKHARRTVSKS